MLDNRIYTFIKLCETMNYRQTADLLSMTQPAVTQHIKYLENLYGCKLFNYNMRKLSKTDAAKDLERYARSMMKNEVDFKNKINISEMDYISIGATKTIGDYVIVDNIKKYLSTEKRNISVIIDNTANLLKMLNDNSIDFAIIEGNFDKSNFDYYLYKKERFVGICSKNHPFAGKKISFNEIFFYDIIIREDGSGTRNILEQILAERSFSLDNFNKKICISSFKIIKELIKADFGISFVYESIAKSDEEIAVFEFEEKEIYREFNVVTLKNIIDKKSNEFFDGIR